VNQHDLEKQRDKKYEAWVFGRINDKEALCHLYRGHRCIPSHDEICRICYTIAEQDLYRGAI